VRHTSTTPISAASATVGVIVAVSSVVTHSSDGGLDPPRSELNPRPAHEPMITASGPGPKPTMAAAMPSPVRMPERASSAFDHTMNGTGSRPAATPPIHRARQSSGA
jgi:hypothetical protein